MKVKLPICIVLLCGVLLSCTRPDSRLAAIDSIMETEPATALARLDSIRPGDLSADDYAYFSLLYTQAQDKNNVIVDSDSLISAAYDRYRNNRSGNLKMRACFYRAVVSFNRSDFKAAMKDAVVAYDIAKEEQSPYWIAKSAELMADIFWYVYNYSQSELYTHEAVDNYLLAGRVDNHRYALCDLASIYLNENKLDEARVIVDSLYEVVTHETPVDSALLDYMSMARSSVLLRTDRIDELKKLFDETSDIDFTNDDNVNVVIMKSSLSNMDQDAESATALLAEAYGMAENDKQRIRVMYQEFRQSFSNGEYKNAAEMADSIILVQSGIVGELLKESVIGAQSDFYSEKAKYQQMQAERRLYALIALSIIALMITILVIMVFRLKVRAKKAEFEANLSSLLLYKNQSEKIAVESERLFSELMDKSEALERLQKRKSQADEQNTIVIEHLFREKWSTLNMLCDEYFKMDDSDIARNVMLSNIKRELEKQRSKRSLKDIEAAVDTYMGNIMSLLRQECTFLKEDDFIFLSLVFAGLSVKAICLFTGIKYKLFYLKKARLSERISNSAAPHKELFLSKIK